MIEPQQWEYCIMYASISYRKLKRGEGFRCHVTLRFISGDQVVQKEVATDASQKDEHVSRKAYWLLWPSDVSANVIGLLGDGGWELVAVHADVDPVGRPTYYFKRPKIPGRAPDEPPVALSLQPVPTDLD